MLIQVLDKYVPGGRFVLLILPIIAFGLGTYLMTPNTMFQVSTAVGLVISIELMWLFLPALWVYFTHIKSASAVWFSLGVFGTVSTTVINYMHSYYFRLYHIPPDVDTSWFYSGVRCAYAFFFACFMLARFAEGSVVPKRGWFLVFGSVGVTGIVALWIDALVN